MRHLKTPIGWLADELPMFWSSPDIDGGELDAGLPDDETDILLPDLSIWLASHDGSAT